MLHCQQGGNAPLAIAAIAAQPVNEILFGVLVFVVNGRVRISINGAQVG